MSSAVDINPHGVYPEDMPLLAIVNIEMLAASGYDRNTMQPTRRSGAALSQIAIINHQELHDAVIAAALCDIHHCPALRLQAIEHRAAELWETR